jgi:hypothetical protein
MVTQMRPLASPYSIRNSTLHDVAGMRVFVKRRSAGDVPSGRSPGDVLA